MKYKQIKKNGVEGFSETSTQIFFYLLIKEKKVLQRLTIFGAILLASKF